MADIIIQWEPNIPSGTEHVNYADLGVSKEQFDALSSDQQNAMIQKHLDSLRHTGRVYMLLQSYRAK